MSPKQCGELALRGNVKTLWLTHYTGLDTAVAMEEAVRATGYAGTVMAATDGLVWTR
jgi:ribonuclease BN (tRNA processing enzyme)